MPSGQTNHTRRTNVASSLKPQTPGRSTRALVVGVTGMVGWPLCQKLCREGWHVFGLARFTDPDRPEQVVAAGAEPITFDILNDDPSQLPEVDVVFLEVWDRSHFLNHSDPAQIWALNYNAVGRLVQRYAASAIINGSSASLYGPRADRASVEDDLPRPDNVYALSRLAQEKLFDFLCGQAGGRAVHLRYCHANDQKRGHLRRMADAIQGEISLGPAPDQKVQVIGLHDFVRCTALAGAGWASMPDVVNVAHPRVWTHRELAERIRSELGCGRVIYDRETGGVEDSVWANTNRMIECFGPPEEDLEDLIGRVTAAAKVDYRP